MNYDDAFRTLLNDCPQLILPVLNETFGTNYDGTEKVVFEPNEHFLNQQAGNEDKIITDTSFAVISNLLPKSDAASIRKFHWECESSKYDPTVLIRIYEYGSQIALDYNHRLEGDELIVEFPNAALLLLRSTKNTPDQMKIRIVVPGGASVSYPVPTLKVQDYTLEQLYQNNLLFLLPFYLMRYDNQLEKMEGDEASVRTLIDEYQRIRKHLDELQNDGNLSLVEKHAIIDMINHVAQLRCAKLDRIRKGVNQIMAGELLYSEAVELRDKSRAEGRAEGRVEGHAEGWEERGEIEIVTGIRRAMDKQHLSLDAAMDYMDIPRENKYKYALHFCEPEEAVKYQCD